MALQALNKNEDEPLGGPNSGLSVEKGDNWNAFIDKANAMLAELYDRTGGQASAGVSGLIPQHLPVTDAKAATGVGLAAAPAAGVFGLSVTPGTSARLTGETATAGTVTDNALFELVLPANYVAGKDITVTVDAQSAGAGTITTETVDLKAYLVADNGSMGADLIAAAAKAITQVATGYAFTIPGAGLVPGDHLMLELTAVITTSAGSANSQINSVKVS